MEQKMRRKDRTLPEEEAFSILNEGEYGILSTVGKDGEPYGRQMSYALDDSKIYIHGATDCGRKFQNIEENRKVCFTVVGKTKVLESQFSTEYESVIVQGIAKKILDQEKYIGLLKLVEKYSVDYLESGRTYISKVADKADVYQIEITAISGKARRKNNARN